jgi:hypothetical protein
VTQKKISEGFTAGQVTVGATATLIVPAGAGRETVTIVNNAAVDVFLGPAGVTITTGVLLAGVKGQTLSLPTTNAIYGVVATATSPVSYIDCN